jgi:hypothetical protein
MMTSNGIFASQTSWGALQVCKTKLPGRDKNDEALDELMMMMMMKHARTVEARAHDLMSSPDCRTDGKRDDDCVYPHRKSPVKTWAELWRTHQGGPSPGYPKFSRRPKKRLLEKSGCLKTYDLSGQQEATSRNFRAARSFRSDHSYSKFFFK